MHAITRRSAPALLAALAGAMAVPLAAQSAADPVFAAIAAAEAALLEHNECCTREDDLCKVFYAERSKLPPVTYAGINFQSHSEVDAHFERANRRANLVADLRKKMKARGLPVGPWNPVTEDVPSDWMICRDRIHEQVSAWERDYDAISRRLGLDVAKKALDQAANRMIETERAAMSTVPTTPAGVAALALYAAKTFQDDSAEDEKDNHFYLAFQSIAAFHTQRA